MRICPLTFAVVLPTLWAAHNLGDHVAQTDHQAACKVCPDAGAENPPSSAEQARALAGHIGTYQAVQAAALAAALPGSGLRPSWRGVLAGTLFSAVSHTVLDRRWPVRWVMRHTGSVPFSEMEVPTTTGGVWRPGMARTDQALHHGCLLVSALLMALRRR